MEVPGKKLLTDASVLDASYCQPCSQDGENLPAEAYCTFCLEFMCSHCANVHKNQKISRSHALLDKRSMPTSMKDQSHVPQTTEPCNIHPEEFIKYFCPTHQTLNCGHCLAKEHRTCHVDIIAEISMRYKDCKEYEDTSKAISHLSNALENCVEDVEIKLKLIKELAEDEVSNLREYRNKINTYFDEREKALLKIIEKMKSTDETRLHSLKPKCGSLRAKVEEIKSKLAEQEENTSQLFIEVKKAQKQIQSLQSCLADIKQEMTFQRYQIRKDPATERLLSSSTGLGTVDELASSEGESLNSKSCAESAPEPSMHAEARTAFLYGIGKQASEKVTEKAKEITKSVEDKTFLGDFTKEQETFVTEKKEKDRKSEAAVPPWVGYNEEDYLKAQILSLSQDRRNVLRNPPTGIQFQFDFDAIFPVAMATLQEDTNLQKMRFQLVPKEIKDDMFWRNYFYRVSLIKQSTQLTSLAQQAAKH